MSFVHKLIKRTDNSEQGFIFLVALMAIVILTAIGFFALTMISGDLMITSRLVGERKAFSAAESGVHAVYTALNFNDLTALKLNDSTTLQWNAKRQVDSTNDSSTRFSAAIPARTGTVPVKGYSEELGYASGSFKIIVTGTDSTYGSSVSIAMGAADLPAPRSTEQGK